MRLGDFLRGAVEDAFLCCLQHAYIVEGIADCNDPEIQSLELLDSLQFLVLETDDLLRHEALLVRLQEVTEDHGVSKLVKDWQGILLKAIGQDEGARNDGLQPLQEVLCSGKHANILHHLEHILELDAMPPQRACADLHQLVVVWLLSGCDLQLLDSRLGLDLQPGLRCERARHVANQQPHTPGGLRWGRQRQRPRQDPRVRAEDAAHAPAKVVVAPHDRELWVRLGHLFGRAIEDPTLSRLQHGNIVERIADGDNAEVHPLESLYCLALLVLQPQLVAGDEALLIDREGIAKDRGVAQLLKHGHGVLFKGVGQQQDPRHDRLQPFQELLGPWQRLQVLDDVTHVL
mmetsp:Transcript_40923/g.113781  ORF Transcript_40923/g.113781 Transcript_40923/m.113781 type:complete len:346 (+) Transcript_40923:127-1164(+)